ncbi:MAG: UDP-N-acetylglucosamine--N-acetylmuramyl-(pentapeptide) pyrophosphoryl-undecaprenol N-acetylglucosamine transferase, partial [Muribaculaceae bacterium]|nr:UDP-N-acetylglucosamine--N-acetylmuramyl-(pentapeptide) pyrophosphoryl-undecaprenol N-acetylglucosamine transferase [Muribaculaceae bacterium]
QTGKLYFDGCRPVAEKYPDVKAMPFVSDMDIAYRAADMVVARAGAGTISELQLLSVPAILVPSPNVAEDHQRKNALALADVGAAVMIPDAEAPEKLGPSILQLIDDEPRRLDIAAKVGRMALRDSDEKIVDEIMKLIDRK